ncbi:surface presentation of antigens (SPOA) protein [Ammonifex degensii KC4]|uniref:Surface presentation of antigens (SPOA) protein n=1 Tax=Ammonifex degensii (strain DSM 10501 / KC4) TaxID=429009 RepID=C9R9Y4_AMMDK|nr:FliM/FliN family flagellar motor switch protein [Ammonifex degensii]ACX53113.1 surface presentation of antigens (SPOA) protein [Ammonifex degensii KC4]
MQAKISKVVFSPFSTEKAWEPKATTALELLHGVTLEVTALLGEATLTVQELLELREGSVIRLDRVAGEAVDLLLDGQKFGRGEVMVLNERFVVRVLQVFPPQELKGEGGEEKSG